MYETTAPMLLVDRRGGKCRLCEARGRLRSSTAHVDPAEQYEKKPPTTQPSLTVRAMSLQTLILT